MTLSELQLAARNLLRNRRRSASTLLALAIGLVAILLFAGFKTNIKYSMLTAYVRMGGHLQIQHRDFFAFGSGNPTAYAISDYRSLIDRISADPELASMIAVITPMLKIGGIAGNYDAGVSRTVVGTGYVARDINRMRVWNEYAVPIVFPHFALEGTASDAAIVGIGVARVLQLCRALAIAGCSDQTGSAAAAQTAPAPTRGDVPSDIAALTQLESGAAGAPRQSAGEAKIELLASSGRGAPNVAALHVVAAEDQGFKELDEISVILHLDAAQRLVFGRGAAKVTAVIVQLHHTADQPAAVARIEELLRGRGWAEPLAVRTVEELNPFYVQSLELFDLIFGFIFILIGGIVLFTVSNTMNTAVVERTVEIGTLRAIGLRRSGILRLFVAEGALLGGAGAVLGVVLALVIAAIVNRSGLTWLPPGSSQWLPLQLRVYGEWSTIAGSSVALLAVSVLSAWWPAWRGAKLDVVAALRHV